MLCNVCKGIEFRPLPEWNRPDSEIKNKNNAAYNWAYSSPSAVARWQKGTGMLHTYYFHHVSPTALRNSVSEQCYLCAMIYFALFSSDVELESEDLILPQIPDVQQPVVLVMFLKAGCMVWQDMSKGESIRVLCGPYQCRLDSLDAFTDSPISDDQYLKKLGQLPDMWAKGLTNSSLSTWSSLNQKLAKAWLSNCQNNHPACRPSISSPELPMRVIDLKPPDGTQQPVLIEPVSQTLDRYVTLSYCWGNIKPMSVMPTGKAGCWSLPALADWPVVYREAIIVTKALGFRYLWIDAICIKQDDRADWEVESGKMAQYYQKSSLTIAAATSPGSQSGTLFQYRNPLMTYPLQLVLNNNGPNPGPYRRLLLASKWDDSPSDHETDSHASPLYARAWVLQEQLLSPRVLRFGRRRLCWQCCSCRESESILLDEGYLPPRPSPLPLRIPVPHHTPGWVHGRNAYYDAWYDMLSLFNTRNITFQDDILPSLSGIAEVLHPFLNAKDEYLAGIWSGDWRVGLLWCKMRDNPPRAQVNHARLNFNAPILEAPSWSWVNMAHKQISYTFHQKILPPYGVLLASNPPIRLISGTIVRQNASSPYGTVISGRLEFLAQCPTITIFLDRAPAIRPDMEVLWLEMNSSYDFQFWHVDVESECFPHSEWLAEPGDRPQIRGDCILDDVSACEKIARDSSLPTKRPSQIIAAKFLPILNYDVEHTEDELDSRTMGLVLTPSQGDDGTIEYKRIGRACINIKEYRWTACTLPEERICLV